jgi:hypothetical protein
LDKPDFRSNKELFEKIKTLELAECVEVKYAPENEVIPNTYAMRGARQHNLYGLVTGRYQPIQDYQLAVPLLDALEEAGLEAQGIMTQTLNGRFYGVLTFHDQRFKKDSLGPKDIMLYGVRIYNGKDGLMGWGAEGMAIRHICSNGCISGDILGRIHSPHLKSVKEGALKFSQMIKKVIDGIPKYEKMVVAARETVVLTPDIRELLLGTGIKMRVVDSIVAEMPTLVPELIYDKVTGWTLHGAVTAYASHRDVSEDVFEDLSSKANRLLVVDNYEQMIEEGRKVIEIKVAK